MKFYLKLDKKKVYIVELRFLDYDLLIKAIYYQKKVVNKYLLGKTTY